MIVIATMFWFFQAVLVLLTLAGFVWLAKLTLDIVRLNADEFVSIWFKAQQMAENIKDRIQEREIARDKADLAIEFGRHKIGQEQLKLSAGNQALDFEAQLGEFVIAGLEDERQNEAEKGKLQRFVEKVLKI